MNIHRFDASVGKRIAAYESANFIMSRIAQSSGDYHIGCVHLAAGGVIGGHVAPVNQLLLVVQGGGTVRASNGDAGTAGPWMDVSAGLAVFWKRGEWHETRTETGLTAIVIECEGLEPNGMPEANGDS